MRYFVTSNINLLNTNKVWKNDFLNKIIKLDNYNKIFISLNNRQILSKYENFVGIIYLNDYLKSNIKRFTTIIKKIISTNQNKKFFFLFYLHLSNNYQVDKKYKLQGIEGIKFYRNNIDECNSKFDKIVLDIKEVFSNISVGKKGKIKHAYDKSGKSTYTFQELVFQNGDSIYLACEDWSIESGYGDSDCLRISLRKKNYSSFLNYKAYK